MAAKAFTIRGQKIRSASVRRFIVVACRPADIEGRRWNSYESAYVPETFTAFKPTIVRRSDDVTTARKARDKYGCVTGGWCVVFDTVTETEV